MKNMTKEAKRGLVIGGILMLVDLALFLYMKMPGARIPNSVGLNLVCFAVCFAAAEIMDRGVNARVRKLNKRLIPNSPVKYTMAEPYGMGIEITAQEDEDVAAVDAIILMCMKKFGAKRRVSLDTWWAEPAAFDAIRTGDWLVDPKHSHRIFCEVDFSRIERIHRRWFDTRNTSFCFCDPDMTLTDFVRSCKSKSHAALLSKGALVASISSDENGTYYVYADSGFEKAVAQCVADIEMLNVRGGRL